MRLFIDEQDGCDCRLPMASMAVLTCPCLLTPAALRSASRSSCRDFTKLGDSDSEHLESNGSLHCFQWTLGAC